MAFRPGGSGPLLSFYGDDFTGSTDSLEALAMAGVPAMLFLEPPSPDDLATRWPNLRAVGVAGTSRSRSPDWMDAHLPQVFAKLRALAPLCHYKTCSTFDSAPEVGNIGRAAEIGQGVFGGKVLVVVGVVRHQRFVVFANLFAAGSVGDTHEIFRIDRHPTMSKHPVTPMREADLRLHLAAQAPQRRIAGFDFRRMLAPDADAALQAVLADNDLVILDTSDAATTRATGALIAAHAARGPAFLVGSSGVEYALVDHLTNAGVLPIVAPPTPRGPAEKIVAVCGSCSPITESQIAWAEANGFFVIAADTVAMVQGGEEIEARTAEMLADALSKSTGVVLHSARGPADPRLAPTRATLEKRGLTALDSSRILGNAMGRTLRLLITKTGVSRVVLAGGDSSSHTVDAMGVEALAVAGPLVPGAPLCRIHSTDAAIDGVEMSLKGGQVGGPDFFGRVLAGR